MEIGSRVEITDTDYNTFEDTFLANGEQGVVVDIYQTGMLIVSMDNCKDPDRDWSFYPNQVKEI